MPTSDDISFLEIEVLPEPVVPIPLLLLAPAWVQAQRVDGRIRVSWAPVPEAEEYELEWTKPTGEREAILCKGTRWVSQVEGESGEHALRVRALAEKRSSDWSSVRRLRIPPPSRPRRLPWFAYAGAGVVLVAFCLLAVLGGRLLMSRVIEFPPPMATSGPTAPPAVTTSQMPFPSPTGSPLPVKTPTRPTALLSTPVPSLVPTLEGTYRLPGIPPHIAPLQGEEMPPEQAMVVVGGLELEQIDDSLYRLHIARQDRLTFQALPALPGHRSTAEVEWMWLVYPARQDNAEVVSPLLRVIKWRGGQEEIWGEVRLRSGQEANVFGVHTDSGLDHFLSGYHFHVRPGAPVLIEGTWVQEAANWRLEVHRAYWLPPGEEKYISLEGERK